MAHATATRDDGGSDVPGKFDEIRATTARTLELLEQGEHAWETVPVGDATSMRTGRSGDATRARWGVPILSDGGGGDE